VFFLFSRASVFSCHFPRFFPAVSGGFSGLRGDFFGRGGGFFFATAGDVNTMALKLSDVVLISC
jgi:hypothetical protein